MHTMTPPIARWPQRRQTGFTLIEILVALLVITIGLLGVAMLQGVGVNNSHISYVRSVASIHVQNMAERMRANISAVDANDYAGNVASPTIDYATITTTFDCRPDDSTKPAFTGANTACTPAQQAQADAVHWLASIGTDLPSGTGQVTCNDIDTTDANPCSVGSTHTITVNWREKDMESNAHIAKSFATVFRP